MFFDHNHLPDADKELTAKQLKIGYWFTANRLKLYQALIIGLIIFDVVVGGYNLFKWTHYLLFGYSQDQKLLRELAMPLPQSAALRGHFAAQPLMVEEISTFFSGGKTDIAAWLRNPNPDFLVYFDYYFLINGQKMEKRKGFLLPAEVRPIAELGYQGLGVKQAGVQLENFSWKRISAHQFAALTDYITSHLRFSVSDLKFVSWPFNRLNFNIKNDSFYGYWQVDFLMALKDKGKVMGMEKITVDNFQAGEKRNIEITLDAGFTPDDLQIFPELNIFDPGIYSH